MRVLHVITGLGTGGAERQLVTLTDGMRREGHDIRVASLRGGGENADRLRSCGIPLHELGMDHWLDAPAGWFRLAALLRRMRPDVVQSWLYHADLLATLASPSSGKPALVWNLRCAELDPADHGSTMKVVRLLARWSRKPRAVVVNSRAGQEAHAALGYRPRRWEVIPNGVDTQVFVPSVSARLAVRRELSLSDDTPLVGLVARYHPMKDHGNFLAAAARVRCVRPDVHFVLVGRGIEWSNEPLGKLISQLGFDGCVHLLGERRDMEMINAALDIATCSSYSEGFPNVLAEAMSCGVPCVGTDVGDAASIVGNTGAIVLPRDASALADAIIRLVNVLPAKRRELGQGARERIAAHFSMNVMLQRYMSLYRDIAVA